MQRLKFWKFVHYLFHLHLIIHFKMSDDQGMKVKKCTYIGILLSLPLASKLFSLFRMVSLLQDLIGWPIWLKSWAISWDFQLTFLRRVHQSCPGNLDASQIILAGYDHKLEEVSMYFLSIARETSAPVNTRSLSFYWDRFPMKLTWCTYR